MLWWSSLAITLISLVRSFITRSAVVVLRPDGTFTATWREGGRERGGEGEGGREGGRR